MLRDFLGLRSFKEQSADANADSAAALTKGGGRGVEMQWSFSNKESSVGSQYLYSSRASSQVVERPSSYGLMTISTPLDANQKSHQKKKMSVEKQGGGSHYYPIAAYGCLQQFGGANSAVRSQQEMRTTFPFLTQPPSHTTKEVLVNNPPPPHPHGQKNIVCSSINNQQLLGGVPIMTLSVLPTTASGSLVGSTDISAAADKQSGEAPAQLTIFYDGSVNVFNDVSPEKAQAIMLLAGNGSSVTRHKTVSVTQVQQPQFNKTPAIGPDYSGGNIPHHTEQFLGLQLNVSANNAKVVSPPHHSLVELPSVKSVGALQSPVNTQLEPSKVTCSAAAGSSTTTIFQAVALPQARKASLARFLEKRKERMTISSPYHASKVLLDGNNIGTENLNIPPQTVYS